MDEQFSPVFFGAWLKRRRKVLDLTQEALAKRVVCSLGALRKVEAGERKPSKQLAELLARALEIPDEDLQTFIRVARGELNLERLQESSYKSTALNTDMLSLRQTQGSALVRSQFISAMPSISIPVQVTPLVGRENEITAIERLFHDPLCRLLTLTGIGGIGKTRLAIEFVAQKGLRFPGGVYYIPLVSVMYSEKVIYAIADAIGFGFSGPADPKEQLLKYLSSSVKRETLFVFDSLEHLVAQDPTHDIESGVVGLVSDILQRVTNLKILGTSRESLNIHGEWTYELHGLSVPPDNFVGQLEEYSSVALFVKSAQRVWSDFRTDPENQASLIKICQLVQGVPLAIELAAAWVGMLSCQEIAQEIQSNMDFLKTSMRDIPERHRSLHATFDHSWNLLSEEEQRTLCQLSVFRGGFDRNAAIQITGATLPLLASLRAKSLLRRTESGRYELHEVIRQYAMSHLEDRPNNLEAYERHSRYYLTLLHDYEGHLKSASQQDALRQLTDEIDNIRAAWAWAVENAKYDQLGKAGRAFGWYFEIVGLYAEGIEQLELLVQELKYTPREQKWLRVFGLTLIHQALLYFRKGEFKQARILYEESIGILRSTGDPVLLADALIFLGIIMHMYGEYTLATSLFEEGLVLANEQDALWFKAMAIYNLGYIASLQGHYAEGYKKMTNGLEIWRALGDPHAIALGLNFLVQTLNQLGHYQQAKAFMFESIALCDQAKNRWGMGTAYRFLGLTCIDEGQFTEAQAHLRRSLEIFGEYFTGWDIARTQTYLGNANMLSGDIPGAQKAFLDALRLSLEIKIVPIALDALAGLGDLQARSGEEDQGLVLCYFVLNHPCSEKETKIRANQVKDVLEIELQPERVKKARVEAQTMTLELLAQEIFKRSR